MQVSGFQSGIQSGSPGTKQATVRVLGWDKPQKSLVHAAAEIQHSNPVPLPNIIQYHAFQ